MTGASRSATAVRVERIQDTMDYNAAFDYLTKFYKGKDEPMEIDLTGDEPPSRESTQVADNLDVTTGLPGGLLIEVHLTFSEEDAVLALVDFPKQIVVALAVVIKYLTRE